MSDLVVWGKETRKSDAKMSVLQHKARIFKAMQVSKACMSSDLKHRVAVQNKLHDECVEMCKELGAYPEKCTCPDYVDSTDKTPNVVTWKELLGYIDSVEELGHNKNMEWTKK